MDKKAVACYYPPVAVSDIDTFAVRRDPQHTHQVDLFFKVQDHPNYYAAVYVSDNYLGPAVLIDLLTDHAVGLPASNVRTDIYRLPPAYSSYYYWLDFDVGPFAERRSPDGLFAAESGFPVSVTGTQFIGFQPPAITAVTDVPFDRGGKVRVNWWAPSGYQEDADAFNIYRHSYPAGQPGYDQWRVIGWVSPWTNPLSYLDTAAPTGWVNEYMVSIAHHGNFEAQLQPGDGNTGIFNSFSLPDTGLAIDNFAHDQITLLSNDTLRVCPAGDGGAPDGTLQAGVLIWGSNMKPTVGIPPEMIECYVQSDSVYMCANHCLPQPSCLDTLIMDGPTDATGRTTMTASHIGGHGRADLIFGLANSFTRFDTLTVYFKSPDENGDGNVNLFDFASLKGFTSTYQSLPHTYKWYRDFSAPTDQKLPDFAYFSQHYNHVCSGGAQAPVSAQALPNTEVRVDLREVVSASDSRTLQADVSIANAEPFWGAYIALRSDHPALKYVRWEPGKYPGRVLVAPVVRDGVSEIAIGVLDGQKLEGTTLALGRLIYDVTTDGSLDLRTQDFEKRVADIGLVTGKIGEMGSAATNGTLTVQRVVENALAQNHPNPFNPTTMISYSIARPGRVSLSIFSVGGALVRRLVDNDQAPDRYSVTWDGTDNSGQQVASGVYFYQLKTPGFSATKKMVLLK